MADRGKRPGRRKSEREGDVAPRHSGVEARGWTILAHPLFLVQIEKLIAAAEAERSGGPNAKLLAHLLDLALDKIPREPGSPAFRHGGSLSGDRRHWFRGKTGNGRYRLFYRFQSAARIIVYAWVNDAESLRTYGSSSDAYAVFSRMLDAGYPPEDWNALVAAASKRPARRRLGAIARRRPSKRK